MESVQPAQFTPSQPDHSELIGSYFRNQLKPPGRRLSAKPIESVDAFRKYDRLDGFNNVQRALGQKAKRTLDRNRSMQTYYSTREIHRATLNHYENMDWWERDTSSDFLAYVDDKTRVFR